MIGIMINMDYLRAAAPAADPGVYTLCARTWM